MPRESITPYFLFTPDNRGGDHLPLASFYALPTAAMVSVPEVEISIQTEFMPVFRIIMPNVVDSANLWVALIVPGGGAFTLNTQIRVSPVYGGVSTSFPTVSTAEGALNANPLVQQIAGVPFRQVSVWANVTAGLGVRAPRIQFCMIVRKSGCCQPTQFVPGGA